jgi:hypothetical protein
MDRNTPRSTLAKAARSVRALLSPANASPEPVAMFHTGRSGSTVLERMLNQHPNIIADGEVFAVAYKDYLNQQPPISAEAFFDLHMAQTSQQHPAKALYIFQVKYLSGLDLSHFDKSLPKHLSFLRRRGVARAIVLTRKNTLRRLVSTLIAVERGQYHQPADTAAQPVTVYLDVDRVHLGGTFELANLLQQVEDERSQLLRGLCDTGFKVIELEYETHIEPDPKIACDQVQRFLGQQIVPLHPTLSKIQNAPLSQTLRNFSQVEARLRGTPFEWMLHS